MREISKPHPNAKEYWPLRKGAFRAITRLHDLKGREERAPRYLAGGYDAEDNPVAITEQLGPAEDFDQTLRSALGSNPFVRETLEAWGLRVRQSSPDSWPELLNKDRVYAHSWDIPVFSRDVKSKQRNR
jgi:hypothetical protein